MRLLKTKHNGNTIYFIIEYMLNAENCIVYNPTENSFFTERAKLPGYVVLYCNNIPKPWRELGVKHIGIENLRMKVLQAKKNIDVIPVEVFLKDFKTFQEYPTAYAYLFAEGLNWIDVNYNGKRFV